MREPAVVREHLSRDQFRLYELIWKRFVASQMQPALLDVTTVDVAAPARYQGAEGVVTKEAIQAYPDLPVSVGLIAADVQPLLGGLPSGIKFARQLYAMPQVEVASHTHTHPYHWSFFENYDRAKEEAMVKGYRPPAMPLRERFFEHAEGCERCAALVQSF